MSSLFQFKSNFGSIKEEKENNLKILEQLGRKKPKLDVQEVILIFTYIFYGVWYVIKINMHHL